MIRPCSPLNQRTRGHSDTYSISDTGLLLVTIRLDLVCSKESILTLSIEGQIAVANYIGLNVMGEAVQVYKYCHGIACDATNHGDSGAAAWQQLQKLCQLSWVAIGTSPRPEVEVGGGLALGGLLPFFFGGPSSSGRFKRLTALL